MFAVAYIMKQDYNNMTWHKKNCHFLGRALRFVFSIMPTTKKGRTERRGVVAVTETDMEDGYMGGRENVTLPFSLVL